MAETPIWAFRLGPQDQQALVAIQKAYQLPSLSEAARLSIRVVATERGLIEPEPHKTAEVQREPV